MLMVHYCIVVMLEGFGSEITEEKFCEAVKFGFDQVMII